MIRSHFLSSLVGFGCLLTFTGCQWQQTETSTPTTIKNTNVTTPASIPSGWTTYTNSDEYFSLSYPEDLYSLTDSFTVKPDDGQEFLRTGLVSVDRQEQIKQTNGYETALYDITVNVYPSVADLPNNAEAKLSLQEWMLNEQEQHGSGYTEVKQTTLGGLPAFSGMSGSIDAADPVIYVEHNGKIYSIHNEHVEDTGQQNDLNAQVIQTFQFTD